MELPGKPDANIGRVATTILFSAMADGSRWSDQVERFTSSNCGITRAFAPNIR